MSITSEGYNDYYDGELDRLRGLPRHRLAQTLVEGREQMSKQTNPADTSAQIALPFKRSSHRQISNANGHVILEVWSGGCSSNEEADAIEELIVRACNRDHAFDDLVAKNARLLEALDKSTRALIEATGETA